VERRGSGPSSAKSRRRRCRGSLRSWVGECRKGMKGWCKISAMRLAFQEGSSRCGCTTTRTLAARDRWSLMKTPMAMLLIVSITLLSATKMTLTEINQGSFFFFFLPTFMFLSDHGS